MGLFNFGKKNKTNGVVWRNSAGEIACPGDSCKKDCDNTCPIYLNTQAVMLMQIGQGSRAIQIYEEALRIALDYYDAWNNLAGIYGQMGNYQKAYDCYKKAREINSVKPNPVYGLMISSRDLGNYQECLSWCDVYKTLSDDGRERAIRDEVKAKIDSAPESSEPEENKTDEKNKTEVVKTSAHQEYMIIKYDKSYAFIDNTGDRPQIINTPGGKMFITSYYSLAERLFEDIQKYGAHYMSAESLLPWHYTMCESFASMSHKEIEDMLDSCFMQKPDWTYDCCDDEAWISIFGTQVERVTEIREWLSKCTHMQMNAACCIGNAYHSINIAFVLALIMENHDGKSRMAQFKMLADLIAENSFYGRSSEIIKAFNNFDLYYGIHLDEFGLIIKKTPFGITAEKDEEDEEGFAVTEEILVGRNYYHYTEGKKDNTQPFLLNHDLASCLSEDIMDEDDEDDEEENDELADYIPEDCWVKKISAADEGESYYIIAIEVKDGKSVGITVLLDEVSRMGGGMFFIPGMVLPGNHSYEEIDIEDYEDIENELDCLKKGRFISKDFSFAGKKLPEVMIENDKYNGDDTRYMVCLQSAHRLAYMDLFINTDQEGIIEDFDYSTYQSTGNGYGDMFSRPQVLADKNEEAIDMLLYIVDKYTDEEYAAL